METTVITENPESKLVARLLELDADRRGWQVGVLLGTQLRPAHRHIIRMWESALSTLEVMKASGGTAYFCADADVVFLFPANEKRVAARLENIVHNILPFLGADGLTMDGLVTLNPLNNVYDEMVAMVRSKKLALIQDNLTLAAQQLQAEKIAKQNYHWSPELFAEALRKRAARGDDKLAAVIEDDPTLRQVAREVLRSHYGIMPSADGYEGLEMYNHYAPDLVFLDIEIPYINGLKVLSTIIEHDPDAIVIMVTGNNSSETLLKARQIGAKGFVTKPFTTETLLKHARHAMSSRPAQASGN